jgi:hypothetical protein
VHLLAEDAERVSLGKKSVQAQNRKQAQQRTILGKLQARLHDDLEARHGELKVLRNQGFIHYFTRVDELDGHR